MRSKGTDETLSSGVLEEEQDGDELQALARMFEKKYVSEKQKVSSKTFLHQTLRHVPLQHLFMEKRKVTWF